MMQAKQLMYSHPILVVDPFHIGDYKSCKPRLIRC